MNTILKKKSADVDMQAVRRISDEYRLHPRLVELLFSRGITDGAEISRYLHPDVSDLNDPFLMLGMREAVGRIKEAMNAGERIVVYGDYDADGVCSSSVLALYFSSHGADVVVHIPSRVGEGYGLNVASIEKIIEEFCPDLILTCDCGISGIDEVEHCKDLGVDVIVTDHHEPGNTIPDCTVVNPKQPGDEYPDKYLCGAGVVLKLVQALCGDDSYLEYLDLAAVATIADLVPLLGENRLIVQLGLAMMADGRGNVGLKNLLRANGLAGAPSSSDIAFKIAPRINAAGRMGDAYRAFEMLTTRDEGRIKEIIAEIDADNERRKSVCDEIYAEAEIDLTYEDMSHSRAIVLSNPSWAKGVTGIAAARFAGEYNRPTFILVDRTEEGIYKGTARGIAGVNIYDALTYCADLLTEYGGHTGAAGFSIHEENIPAFKRRINEYLDALPRECFLPTAEYDLDVDAEECDKKLLDALSLTEPTGNGNTRPLLRIRANGVGLAPCKNPQHSAVQIGNLHAYAFNFYARNQFLMGSGAKDIVLELAEGINGGVSGYIKAVSPEELYISDAYAGANYLAALMLPPGKAVYTEYDEDELPGLAPDSVYGTLYVCADRTSYERAEKLFGSACVTRDYNFKSEKNNYSGIIVSPTFDTNLCLGNYTRIIFMDDLPSDNVAAYINGVTKAEIFVPKTRTGRIFEGVTSDRGVFAKYYSAIICHAEAANANAIVYFKRLSSLVGGLDAKQFVVCLSVFDELGFLSFDGGRLTVNKNVKRPLTDSVIYNKL